MITNVQECIKPISYIKTNAADMMNFVNDKKEPLIITQNGEQRFVADRQSSLVRDNQLLGGHPHLGAMR